MAEIIAVSCTCVSPYKSPSISGTLNGGILTYISCMDTAYVREPPQKIALCLVPASFLPTGGEQRGFSESTPQPKGATEIKSLLHSTRWAPSLVINGVITL